MNLIQTITPRLPKRSLFFLAALVWTFAGSMLLFRGILFFLVNTKYLLLRLLVSIICGLLFYIFLFSKISLKHANRILHLKQTRPCLFSFFNTKSYVIMIVMISMGIWLRKSGIVPVWYLAPIYFTMGIPLVLSSLRFYNYGIYYKVMNKVEKE